jgi:hypothetical protein
MKEWIGITYVEALLCFACLLAEGVYWLYNPYLEMEHHLYENDRNRYYIVKYSKWLISFILGLYLYTAVRTVIRHCL